MRKQGGKSDSKAKMGVVIGRVSVNISEIASKMDKSLVEEKLPLSLQIDGFAREASLTVNSFFDFDTKFHDHDHHHQFIIFLVYVLYV